VVPQVPVIWGWIAVGTQNSSDTIDDALSEFILLRAGQQQNAPLHKTSNQEAFKVLRSLPDERLPKFLIFNVCGDEIQQGPTFNYARVFTWWGAAKTIHRTFERVANKFNERDLLPEQHNVGVSGTTINNNNPIGSLPAGSTTSNNDFAVAAIRGEVHPSAGQVGAQRAPSTETRAGEVELQAIITGPSQRVDPENIVGADRVQSFRMRDLSGNIDQLNQYCGFGSDARLKCYPSWKEIIEDGDILIRIIAATFVGLFVQWGTTIPAVIIAYLTDVKGVGCRSGSYLIYGIAGTLAFCFFLVSTFFSHAAVLSHEAALARREVAERESSHTTTPPQNSSAQQSQKHVEETTSPSTYEGSKILASLAVLTRIFGQLAAIGNAIWIILSSLWELVGFYDSCWCDGAEFSAGENTWVVLFKQGVDLRERAEGPWAGGVAMSVLVGFISWFGFVLLCKDVKER